MNIVKARLDEITDILIKQLIVPGFNLTSGVSFLLTGEGSNLVNIEKYFVNFIGPNVKKIDKNNLERDVSFEKNFASCLGAIKIIKDGWETEAIPKISDKNVRKIGFFNKFFGSS